MKVTRLLLVVVAFLLLVSSAIAMSSPNYRLDWSTLLDTGGGSPAGSGNYAIEYTVGQSFIGTAHSANYNACLGYWCQGWVAGTHRIYLPLMTRDNEP
jgi:hypothetical protein